MKILYINALDYRYGSTYRARNIVKALSEIGHKVTYAESNVKYYNGKEYININQKDTLIGYFSATYSRFLLALTFDYDMIFIQKFIPLVVPSIIAARLRGKKCIVDWDDLDFCFQENIFKKIIVFLCEHIFPCFSNCITTHSNRLKQYAQKLGLKNIYIVNQIVDFLPLRISDQGKNELKRKIGSRDKKIVCFLGTLTLGGARDLDIIIKMVSRVIHERKDVFFLIIGGGPLEGEIRKILAVYNLQITTDYAITGNIFHEDVQKYLSICDIGLVYMRDNLGNRMRMSFKVLEYLSEGIPVLGRLVGETKDRLGKFCFSYSHQGDFSSRIEQVLNNLKRLDMSRLEYLSQNHSLQSIQYSLKQIINSEEVSE